MKNYLGYQSSHSCRERMEWMEKEKEKAHIFFPHTKAEITHVVDRRRRRFLVHCTVEMRPFRDPVFYPLFWTLAVLKSGPSFSALNAKMGAFSE